MSENERPTQCDRIMKYFRVFGSITQDEADKEYGIKRLASRIEEMRNKKGIKITSHTEKGHNRFGEPVSYTRYYLNEVWFIGRKNNRYEVTCESREGSSVVMKCDTYDDALACALELQRQDRENGIVNGLSKVYKVKDSITGEFETIKW